MLNLNSRLLQEGSKVRGQLLIAVVCKGLAVSSNDCTWQLTQVYRALYKYQK
jgi:hypothetical protein